ncbi:MAG TPA: tetratricopeptide repeat protein [Ktedonobacterales bacterium]|nr:tetratricopeptide repeat protein [Ktedonobacterales bacterium]
MHLPHDIASRILGGTSLGFSCTPDGNVQEWPRSTYGIYPPVGYLPWNVLEIGNGDTYGYYWPVGKENQDPVVCTTEHDTYRFVPFASTLEGCLRLVRASDPGSAGEVRDVARAFAVKLADSRKRSPVTDVQALFALDTQSPQLLLEQARAAMRRGDLGSGEGYAAQALEMVPEFGEAAFVLSQFHQRQGRLEPAARALLVAIGSPICLSGGYNRRLRCLKALQRMKDDVYSENDPLWRERQRLTFQTGVTSNDDFHIYDQAIEDYHLAGSGTRAVWLRMLIGELMSMETRTFQERYGWTPAKYLQDVRNDLLRAGFSSRVTALGLAPDS